MPPKKDYWDIIKDEDVFLRYFNEEKYSLGAAIAQWIRLHLPSWSPRF